MAQKLWEKNVQVDQEVDTFTVGKDREMDLYLAKYDVLGSMAHITMLESIGLLTKEELTILLAELNPFIKPMVSKPLQDAIDKISTMLASLPY